jgi:exodeoxyribonuclease-3
MKIATFNVNSIGKREGALMAWLARESPDIVCLQELKAPDERFPALTVRAAGYGAVWHGQTSYNGVAILARDAEPVLRRRGLPGDPDDTHSRYIEAQVKDIVVGCLYLPNGNPAPGPKFDYKLAWMQRLNQHAAKLFKEGVPAVLAGDYNVVPTDEDIYDPKNWRKDALLQPQSREAFAALLKQGWTDALRAHLGSERIYTYWDYWRKHFENNRGLRIDHLLLSRELAGRVKAVGVDRWVRGEPEASDHAPTWIEIS